MLEYIKFWLAKEVLVPLIVIGSIAAVFGLTVGGFWIAGKFERLRDAKTGRREP